MQDAADEITLRDEGDTVSWEAACGATFVAEVDGEAARVRKTSCPAETIDGTTRNLTIEDGKLTLGDTTLRMELEARIALSGAVTGTCDLTIQGTLSRED